MSTETTFRTAAKEFALGVHQALEVGTLQAKQTPKEPVVLTENADGRTKKVLEIVSEQLKKSGIPSTEAQIRSKIDMIVSIVGSEIGEDKKPKIGSDTILFDEFHPFIHTSDNLLHEDKEFLDDEQIVESIRFIRAHVDGSLHLALDPTMLPVLQSELIRHVKKTQEFSFRRKLSLEKIADLKKMHEEATVIVKTRMKTWIKMFINPSIAKFQKSLIGKEQRNIQPISQLVAFLNLQDEKFDTTIPTLDPSKLYTNFLTELGFFEEANFQTSPELVALLRELKKAKIFTEDLLNRVRVLSEILVAKEVKERHQGSKQASVELEAVDANSAVILSSSKHTF